MHKERKARKNMVNRLLAGLLAGLANGLFGAGGGMVAVTALKLLCGFDDKRAHACAISIMLPLSTLSGAVYAFHGSVDYNALVFVAPALAAGGYIGAQLTGKLDNVWLNRIFCALMVFAAMWMLL